MTGYYVSVRPDGSYEVYATTNGIDRTPVPTGVFGKPRDAIRYAEMRDAHISPLRSSGEAPASPPAGASPDALTGTDRHLGR